MALGRTRAARSARAVGSPQAGSDPGTLLWMLARPHEGVRAPRPARAARLASFLWGTPASALCRPALDGGRHAVGRSSRSGRGSTHCGKVRAPQVLLTVIEHMTSLLSVSHLCSPSHTTQPRRVQSLVRYSYRLAPRRTQRTLGTQLPNAMAHDAALPSAPPAAVRPPRVRGLCAQARHATLRAHSTRPS